MLATFALLPFLAATPSAGTGAVDAQAATAGATASTGESLRECVSLGRASARETAATSGNDGGGVALASIVCVDEGVLLEERYVERHGVRDEKTVHRRDIRLPLRLAAAPTISEDDDEQHHRRALIDATRKVAGIDFDVGGLMALLHENEAAREVVARALAASAPADLHPIFGQDLPAVAWVQLEAAAVFSSNGQLVAVSHAHTAPPQPAGDGYGGYASVLLKTSDLGVVYRAPGFIADFDKDKPVVTAVIARCGKAPVTAGEFFTPSGCADGGDERWEAVFDVATGRLRDVKGPFKKSRECGETGPDDEVTARYQWCVP